jgi:hypothetical protein|tara:strand:- start:1638 stop:1811 length:174 start_codon:yes stop_codon:yes gene_type:complete
VKSVKDDWLYQLWIQYIQNQKDFYWENGKKVMTEKYHIKRGSCCDSGCRHCPYKNKS